MGIITYNNKEYYMIEQDSQRALHEVGIHTFRYYPKEHLLICSELMAEEFGVPQVISNMPEALTQMLIHEDDWNSIYDLERRLLAGTKRVSAILRTKEERVSRVTITAVDSSVSHEMVTLGVVEDMEEDVRQNDVIQALNRNYQSVYYVDFDKNVIYPYRLSDAIEKSYGPFFRSKPSYETAITAYIMNTVHPEDRQEMLIICSTKFLAEQFTAMEVFSHDYRAVRDGKIVYCRMKAVDVSKKSGMHEVVMGFADISVEKKREIERYAYVDTLTGGDNMNRFKTELDSSRREGFIISMDIHAFKTVNVACGTAKGDDTLRMIWKSIKRTLGPMDLAGHINADHYAIFYATEDETTVSERLDELNALLEKLSTDMDIPRLVPYFGVAKWDYDKGVEICFGEANTSKHDAKDRTDVNYVFHSEADSERIAMEKLMEDRFEESIRTGAFEVWYQAKYDPNTRKMVGAEALSRWRRPEGNMVSPGLFIPLFEKNGQIRQLDEYVFRSVCKQQKKWQEEGRTLFPISVNLSRASMYFRNVVDTYRKITQEIGIDPQYVPIEITESAAISNSDIQALSKEFHDAGFLLHLDDFGTGYSSLASLNVLHFDTLKLDKSLVDYIGQSEGDKLIKHTIALCKDLGMHVVAEGVEEEKQVEFLLNQKCDSIQGFYFAKPLPIDEFRGML